MLTFDLNGEIERLRKEDAWQGERNSKTLVKHSDFRIVWPIEDKRPWRVRRRDADQRTQRLALIFTANEIGPPPR